MEFKNLLSPIKIGPVEIKNRIVMAPMLTRMANADGTVSEAKGGKAK